MTIEQLRQFIIESYERANIINGFSSYISYSDQLNLIKLAKYYRKLVINETIPAFTINCLDEDTNKLINLAITKKHSLKRIILLLTAKNFYFTLQQIKSFVNS